MYQVGQFSKINKITVKTLRYYDEVGLLKPAYIDKYSGYRYYTSEQLPKLHKILAYRQIGLSISEILEILDNQNTIEEVLQSRKAEIEREILKSQEQLSNLTYYLKNIEEGFTMNYDVRIKELPECIVYSKRMVISSYNDYFDVIPKIGEAVMDANPKLKCREPEYCFVIYHDGEYKEENIDVEFCEAVTDFGKDTEEIKFKKMAKIPEAATILHKGPYDKLGEAYGYLFNWIETNGYKVEDNPRESYIDGIWNKEDSNEWLTEIQVPISK